MKDLILFTFLSFLGAWSVYMGTDNFWLTGFAFLITTMLGQIALDVKLVIRKNDT